MERCVVPRETATNDEQHVAIIAMNLSLLPRRIKMMQSLVVRRSCHKKGPNS